MLETRRTSAIASHNKEPSTERSMFVDPWSRPLRYELRSIPRFTPEAGRSNVAGKNCTQLASLSVSQRPSRTLIADFGTICRCEHSVLNQAPWPSEIAGPKISGRGSRSSHDWSRWVRDFNREGSWTLRLLSVWNPVGKTGRSLWSNRWTMHTFFISLISRLE